MTAKVWTRKAVEALGVRCDVPTAGSIIAGLGRDQSYRAVKAGIFPVPVIKVGHRLVVPTAPILQLLGLDTPAGGASPKAPPATAADPSPKGNDHGQRTPGS